MSKDVGCGIWAIRNFPETLKMAYKGKYAMEGTNMKDKLIELVNAYVYNESENVGKVQLSETERLIIMKLIEPTSCSNK